jgi:hypothetical protein
MSKERQCLVEDDDGHWYLIQVKDRDEFDKLCYSDDEDCLIRFEEMFAGCCIDGPHRLTFTDAKEDE